MGRFTFEIDKEGFFPILGTGSHLENADAQAQCRVDHTHPPGVSTSEIIVHSHQVCSLTDGDILQGDKIPTPRIGAPFLLSQINPLFVQPQSIQVERQSCDKCFSLTGAHFCDDPIMKGNTSDQLHIIVALAESPFTGLTHNGECFREQIIQRFPLG